MSNSVKNFPGIGIRFFFLLISFLSQIIVCSGQYNIISKGKQNEVLYTIDSENFKLIAGFYFPPSFYKDSIISYGINPLKDQSFRPLFNEKVLSWIKTFDEPMKCSFDDETSLIHKIYLENVNNYTFFLHSIKNDQWYFCNFQVEFERYQLPCLHQLSTFMPISDLADLVPLLNDSINSENFIDKIALVVYPRGEEFKFIVGELKVIKREPINIKINAPLFEELTSRNSISESVYSSFSKIEGSPYIFTSFNYYNFIDACNSELYITSITDDDIKKIKIDVFRNLFKHYPFFIERNIDKNHIMNRLEKISQFEYNAFIDSIKLLVKGFKDPHFYIRDKVQTGNENETIVDPLRVYEINNDFYISAVFDTTLKSQIKIGDRLLAIDSVAISEAENTKMKEFRGSSLSQQHKAVSELLKSKAGDKKLLKLLREEDGDTIKVLINYQKENVFIPQNFIPKQGDFRILNGNIAYFRINLFLGDTWIRFINHIPEMQNVKGIIFDIRNNGGGEQVVALNILSTFIDQPKIITHYSLPELPNYKETVVIRPNELFKLNKPICILINKGTACASETFAYLMQYHANAILIGEKETAGAFAQALTIIFPDGSEVVTNSLGKEVFFPSFNLELTGIPPDINVQINKVNDLYPYNDKILQTAVELLKNY